MVKKEDIREAYIRETRKMGIFCKICSRPSLLKCVKCETIYCSARCQIKDWDQHQFQHSMKDLSISSSSSSSRSSSCDTVSKNAQNDQKNNSATKNVAKPLTLEEEIQLTVNDVAKSVEMLDFVVSSNNKTSTSSSSSSESEPKLLKLDKIIESSDISKYEKCFQQMKITEKENLRNGSVFYWVMPLEAKNSFESYKVLLNMIYEFDDIPLIPFEKLKCFMSSLVMAEVDGQWRRMKIFQLENNFKRVILQDIDSGRKELLQMQKTIIKKPNRKDLLKPAFAFKVKLENESCSNKSQSYEIGKIIELRFKAKENSNKNTENYIAAEVKLKEKLDAEVKPDSNKEVMNELVKIDQTMFTLPERFYVDSIEVEDLPIGSNINILILNNLLEVGKLHVMENVKNNIESFAKMCQDIKTYTESYPSKNYYKPENREMVLVKHSDGYFYRSVCIQSKKTGAKVFFIDYGTEVDAEFKDIVKLPKKLFRKCFSHSIDIQLASGRSITEINVQKTFEHLEKKINQKVNVKIEYSPQNNEDSSIYLATLTDSLVVYEM
ncbi:CLUMA_CG007692, isoform A [Clunio marinus]|uniref:CLUMA_CG007692, isoform A n=1 Tax=Clunio marinus TaxID=568069 RepID=A0A1J1I1H2_9DIPT|nr:CLUMA_CG007692, isoform A [Clunio marinus]